MYSDFFIAMYNIMYTSQPVIMMAAERDHLRAADFCGPEVKLIDVASDDMWARDCGPVYVTDGEGGKVAVDFNFNGWGHKQGHRRLQQAR